MGVCAGPRGALRWDFITRNYALVIQYIGLHGNGVWVTVVYCTLAVLTALIVNPLCAYALSRYNLPYGSAILLFLLTTMAFPAEVALIPNFLMLKQLEPPEHVLGADPARRGERLLVFLMKGFFDSLPQRTVRGRDAGRRERAADVHGHHAAAVQADLRRHRAGRVHQRLRRVYVRPAHLPGPRHVDADGLAV